MYIKQKKKASPAEIILSRYLKIIDLGRWKWQKDIWEWEPHAVRGVVEKNPTKV